jgi:hypothetical protein
VQISAVGLVHCMQGVVVAQVLNSAGGRRDGGAPEQNHVCVSETRIWDRLARFHDNSREPPTFGGCWLHMCHNKSVLLSWSKLFCDYSGHADSATSTMLSLWL